MLFKNTKGLLPKIKKSKITALLLSTTLIVAILACLYLNFAWNRYQQMAESEAMQLAKSVEALLHAKHIAVLKSNTSDENLAEPSLTRLVEATDAIYYAYLLKQQGENIVVIADSSGAISDTSTPTKRSCEETVEINRLPFDTGRTHLTETISLPCGNWIRALVPILDADDKHVIATLGLSYSAEEWRANLCRKMIPDILVVICLTLLVFMLLNLLWNNLKLKYAEQLRRESERSKSMFFSHIPGMVYQCKNDECRTMEFVSEGCYILTGYRAENLIANERISYGGIISPEYKNDIRTKWQQALDQRIRYNGEYEIITKSGERKWVMEIGQGIYDTNGEIKILEGIVLDISQQKKNEFKITYLQKYDYLTGLYNRNYMDHEKMRLDQLKFLPLSIAICDIDGLRMINDAFGHEEGNRLIAKTARLIQGCLSDEYVIGHTGGGEFVLLMPNTDSQSAGSLKTKIKDTIENYNKESKNALYTISISIGYSTKEKESQKIQDIMATADEYLNRRKLLNKNSFHSAIVSSIMATLYAKSQETEEHGQRLGRFCQTIGEQLGLSQAELDDLQLLSKLHDIGKIGIDDHILNKPDTLTEDEWKTMKLHPEIGHRIAMATPQLEHIATYILYHHERWDGTGYPVGLRGQDIPILSRILSIADAFDAMTEDRVYRKAMPKKNALKEIERNAGTQFDPDIAKLFIGILKKQYGF